MRNSGRYKEITKILNAYRIAALGRMMLGKLKSWEDYTYANDSVSPDLSRHQIRKILTDVNTILLPEISNFIKDNFVETSEDQLILLYNYLLRHKCIIIDLKDFEQQFGILRTERLGYSPGYSTLVIDEQGLRLAFPEHFISQDILKCLGTISTTDGQKPTFAARSILCLSHSLIEAYFKGRLWLEEKKIKGVYIGDKFKAFDDSLKEKFEKSKIYRNAIVHPSPRILDQSNSQKLETNDHQVKVTRIFYEVNTKIAMNALNLCLELIEADVQIQNQEYPSWFVEFKNTIEKKGEDVNDS